MLMNLTERLAELEADRKELQEAVRAGVIAEMSLEQVRSELRSAQNWGTWDLLGGGTISTWANRHVRIERIVSTGHASPKGFWYDQVENEWVVVLKGEAKLRFQSLRGYEEPITMKPGDYTLIPARKKHRVEWTTPEEPTVWLAVFFGEE